MLNKRKFIDIINRFNGAVSVSVFTGRTCLSELVYKDVNHFLDCLLDNDFVFDGCSDCEIFIKKNNLDYTLNIEAFQFDNDFSF